MNRAWIVGVDFSGAKDGGKKIWIAEGPMTTGPWRVESCRPASELPRGARDLETTIGALRQHLEGLDRALIGCDFPFGLPKRLMGEADWDGFVAGFSSHYKNAEDFSAECHAKASGREDKRSTDKEAKTPFSAYNLWIYKQTYHGIGGLLGPLILSKRCIVLPMQERRGDANWIVEICPASTLINLELYDKKKPYKGKNPGCRERRRELVDDFVRRDLLAEPKEEIKDRVVEDRGGDALDAIIAGLATKAALTQLDDPVSAAERIEGKVYYKLAP